MSELTASYEELHYTYAGPIQITGNAIWHDDNAITPERWEFRAYAPWDEATNSRLSLIINNVPYKLDITIDRDRPDYPSWHTARADSWQASVTPAASKELRKIVDLLWRTYATPIFWANVQYTEYQRRWERFVGIAEAKRKEAGIANARALDLVATVQLQHKTLVRLMQLAQPADDTELPS